MTDKKRKIFGIIALVVCVCVVGLSIWGTYANKNKEINTVEAEDEEESNYDWLQISTDDIASGISAALEADSEDGPVSDTTTVIEEEDGSYTINRTWGEKQGEDSNSANIGSGGGEVPLAEDGVYYGDHQDEMAATDSTTSSDSSTTSSSSGSSSNASTSGGSTSTGGSSGSTTSTDSSGSTSSDGSTTTDSSSPKSGDTKVENGVTYQYVPGFGWVVQTGSEEVQSNSDAVPGTGETVGSMG